MPIVKLIRPCDMFVIPAIIYRLLFIFVEAIPPLFKGVRVFDFPFHRGNLRGMQGQTGDLDQPDGSQVIVKSTSYGAGMASFTTWSRAMTKSWSWSLKTMPKATPFNLIRFR